MKLLIDMNLSPAWVDALRQYDIDAVHWSTIGPPEAKDSELIRWAVENEHIIFTHDLDFGTALALTRATGPSVIQVRTQDVLPVRTVKLIAAVIDEHAESLIAGALVVIDERRSRVRILPF